MTTIMTAPEGSLAPILVNSTLPPEGVYFLQDFLLLPLRSALQVSEVLLLFCDLILSALIWVGS